MSSSSTQPEKKEKINDEDNDVEMKEEEPTVETVQHPLLSLSNDLFLISSADSALDANERKALLSSVHSRLLADDMSGLLQYLEDKRTNASSEVAYKYLTDNGWKLDTAGLKAIEAKNAKEIEAADAKIKEATEVAGDTEVREAMFNRANLYAKWGQKDKALEEYNVVFDKTVGVASKIDVLLAKLRISLAFLDSKNSQGDPNLKQYKTDLEKAKM